MTQLSQIPTHADLVSQIDAFLLRHDMKPSRLSREATGEPSLVETIRRGRSPKLDTVEKLMTFMARLDDEAVTRAKLEAPLDSPPPEPEEIELPFRSAPVTTDTGASSPTSSPMNGHHMPQPESDSSRSTPTVSPSCSDPELDAA